MTRPDDFVSDQEIHALLHEDPPAKLSPAQRARLRTRLGLADDSEPGSVTSAPLGAAVAADDISVTPPARRSRPVQPSWLVAAAAIVLAGLLVVFIGNRADDSAEIQVADTEAVPFPTAEPTPEPPQAQLCRDHIGPFLDAIETWDGIDNWAFLTDRRLPEPDLVALALDAVIAIERFGAAEAGEAQRLLTELRVDLVAATDLEGRFDWDPVEREANRTAVTTARDEIDEVVRLEGWAAYDGCG